jgi:branched-chain amino acid transport system substrate-binding protein
MRRLRWCAPALAAAALLAAGCGGSDSSSGGGGSDSGKPIRIGASLPLTGDFSEPGKAARQGYQVWEKMVNAQGGLLGRKVQIIVRDDASDQNTVVADYNALISRQKVDMLLGTFSSLLNLPASTVAERNRKLYVEPAGGAPEIFSRGYKHIFFAQQATADHQGDVFADYILKLPPSERPKTAAYPSLDDPFALPVLQGIREKFEKAGIKTVYRTKYANENTNFDSIANAVKAANPDVLLHGATFADGVNFVRALDKVGFDPKYFFQTSAPSFAGQYAKGVGVQNTQGTFYAVSWDAKAETPGNAAFVKTFNQMFGAGEPAEDAADAFAAAQVMQAAVKAVGSIDDQTKLADQWQDGKSQIVLPKAAATSQEIVKRNAGS